MARVRDTASPEAYGTGLVATTGDALLAAGYALVVGGAILAGVVTGPVRAVLAAPLLGFFPGYAVVSVLFPARGVTGTETVPSRWVRGPTWLERVSLAAATSLFVLVLAAVALSAVDVPFTANPLTATVVAVTVVGSILGLFRRLRLPADDRLVVPVAGLAASVRAGTVDARPLDAVLNVALALAVVVAASTLAVGFAAPGSGEAYTDAALLTDDGGELVAGNYTESVERGDATDVTLSVENNEGAATDYTAVVVLERVGTTGEDTVVLEREELDRVTVSAADGETVRQPLSVQPTMLGDDLRLSVFVYEGDAPGTASADTAAHHLYVWLDVEQSTGGSEQVAGGSGEQVAGGSERIAADGTPGVRTAGT